MKVVLLILGIPIYILGFVLGIFSRPLIEGFSMGYFFFVLRSYKDLLKKYGEE